MHTTARAVLITAALFALLAANANAETFSGQCNFTGSTTFLPSTTWVPQYRGFLTSATGSCNGTVGGQAYNGPATLTIDGRMNALMSCGGGLIGSIPALITFGDPSRVNTPRLRLRLENLHTVFLDWFAVLGAYNGYGAAEWVFQVGVNTPEQCLPTNGLHSLSFNMLLRSLTELYG